MFKKIIVKTIKKFLLYRFKEALEAFEFILNVNNYAHFYSNSRKNIAIFTLIIYILFILFFNDCKTDAIQNILNSYLTNLIGFMCDKNTDKEYTISDSSCSEENIIKENYFGENFENFTYSDQPSGVCGKIKFNFV